MKTQRGTKSKWKQDSAISKKNNYKKTLNDLGVFYFAKFTFFIFDKFNNFTAVSDFGKLFDFKIYKFKN